MKRLLWILPLIVFFYGFCTFPLWGMPSARPDEEDGSAPPDTCPPVVVMSSPDAASPDRELHPQGTDPSTPLRSAQDDAAGDGSPAQDDAAGDWPPAPDDPASSDNCQLSTVNCQLPPPSPAPSIPYQSGDTTPTWRPSLAAEYPADPDCSDALLLEKWMAVEGLTFSDLDARDCDQLILVSAQPTDGVGTLTVCYERGPDGSFVPAASLGRMSGHVGKNGIRHDRRRNTDTSPAGLWAISFAFGNEAPPAGLRLPWRQVTPDSDWVCDEDSPYFNTWQERGDPALTGTWGDDVEHLEDYPKLYAYACVIEFNRPPDVVPARGCAIFLHCSERGTGGCVGLPTEDMLSVLTWLQAAKNPYILITGAQNDP